MITKFDAEQFGSFVNFSWDATLRDAGNNTINFSKMNIIYGRNYSGKTTISRLIRSLEKGEAPEKYVNSKFSVTVNKQVITDKTIHNRVDNVRVYNRDFVSENLSFLQNESGEILPFAVIGQDNKATIENIAKAEAELGSVEGKNGISFDAHSKLTMAQAKEKERFNLEKDINSKLAQLATQHPESIKLTPIYMQPNYNITKLRADIDKIKKDGNQILEESEKQELIKLASEEKLHNLEWQQPISQDMEGILNEANKTLAIRITPTKPIQEYLNNSALQMWVKNGISINRNRDTCGFCGQQFPKDLWDKLDKHFNEECDNLDRTIDGLIKDIEYCVEEISSILFFDRDFFYKTMHLEFDATLNNFYVKRKSLVAMLRQHIKAMNKRKNEIYTHQKCIEYQNSLSEFLVAFECLSRLINKNNSLAESLSSAQDGARIKLRLDKVARHLKSMRYEKELERLEKLSDEYSMLSDVADKAAKDVRDIHNKLNALTLQLKDERVGAQKVNDILSHYFGHDKLELRAIEEFGGTTFKFHIYRGEELAYNLSEGECSLVAFCYFIAKLDDADSAGKKLIIFIDDPISSLDSNHIFFIFSLIESCLAKPLEDATGKVLKDSNNIPIYRYEQLFISTHNLDFLKYCKRLTTPKSGLGHFHVFRDSCSSKLLPMPRYLKDYVTELNFLFTEICICATPSNISTHAQCFYNFGNVLRKFLEAYLFFKYPSTISPDTDHKHRLAKFFGSDKNANPLISRLTNELSHLHGRIDRCAEPIDFSEISTTARYVLSKMKSSDAEQYKCFMESSSLDDPI